MTKRPTRVGRSTSFTHVTGDTLNDVQPSGSPLAEQRSGKSPVIAIASTFARFDSTFVREIAITRRRGGVGYPV